MPKDDNNNITNKVQLAVIATELQYVKSEVVDMKKLMTEGYATKANLENAIARIKLLERAVYGLLTLIVAAVVAAGMKVLLK